MPCVATKKDLLLARVPAVHQGTLTTAFVNPLGSNAAATASVAKMKSACPQENVFVYHPFSPMYVTETDAEVLVTNSVVV